MEGMGATIRYLTHVISRKGYMSYAASFGPIRAIRQIKAAQWGLNYECGGKPCSTQ